MMGEGGGDGGATVVGDSSGSVGGSTQVAQEHPWGWGMFGE